MGSSNLSTRTVETAPKVQGYCPMGCGETLRIAPRGEIFCGNLPGCPDPRAVEKILADSETSHVIRVDSRGWNLKHPLRERANDDLLDCHDSRMMEFVHHLDAGTYRSVVVDGQYQWHYIDEDDDQ